MTKTNDIMKYIDQYRVENKIPIYKLTEGIMSTRSYSRLLTGEKVLSFENYAMLLERLRMPLFEFSLYFYNCQFFKNIHEVNFQQLVDEKKYREAYEFIQPHLINLSWKSIFSEKTLPIALKYVEYQLKKIGYSELIGYSRNLIQLDDMLERTLLSLDDFESLFLFSDFCSVKEKRKISDYLIRIILSNDIRILNASVEHTTSRLHRLAIQILTSFDDNDDESLITLKKIVNVALEYQSRAKIYGEDLLILELLFKYYKRLLIENRELLTEFVLSCLGSNEEEKISKLKTILTKEEKAYILNLIKTSRLKKKILFDQDINDESIK